MGNCLKGVSTDDVSLLRGNDGLLGEGSVIPAPVYRDGIPLYYPAPNDARPANQLSEEEQVKIARRIGLMEHLPVLAYDETFNKHKECVICMIEFKVGEKVRYLPCVHVYHVVCINNWLMRSFTCPSCMEPVDAALLTSYHSSNIPNALIAAPSGNPVTSASVNTATDSSTNA